MCCYLGNREVSGGVMVGDVKISWILVLVAGRKGARRWLVERRLVVRFWRVVFSWSVLPCLASSQGLASSMALLMAWICDQADSNACENSKFCMSCSYFSPEVGPALETGVGTEYFWHMVARRWTKLPRSLANS